MMIKVIILLCFLLSTTANGSVNHSSKLTEVINKIKSIKTLLYQNQNTQKQYQQNLQKTELAINHISQRLHKLSSNLTTLQQDLKTLSKNQQTLEKRVKQQQDLLMRQIQFAYRMGINKNQLQWVLGTHDPNKINRLMTYHRFLSLQNKKLLQGLKEDLNALNENKKNMADRYRALDTLAHQQSIHQVALAQQKNKQQQALNHLSLELKSHADELKILLQNKARLEATIKSLQKKASYKTDFIPHHNGKFSWPTQGRIIEKFGSYLHQSELKQNGVLIKAPEGQKVYTVAPGKVIFASWMPGYGLLLIIDHGKGYMTLYGNNSVLFKKNHELVKDHDLIASVGHTGGQQQSALYFALRYNGKPIDPNIWCQ